MTWLQFDGGSSIGQNGSEEGVILLDDEHQIGARITLERDGVTAPFAITCGIYGWMVHTHFLGDEAEARETFERMKVDLTHIMDLIPAEQDPDLIAKVKTVSEAIASFVRSYP
jgi:hypothetical protein